MAKFSPIMAVCLALAFCSVTGFPAGDPQTEPQTRILSLLFGGSGGNKTTTSNTGISNTHDSVITNIDSTATGGDGTVANSIAADTIGVAQITNAVNTGTGSAVAATGNMNINGTSGDNHSGN